jgi:hypothetical protein
MIKIFLTYVAIASATLYLLLIVIMPTIEYWGKLAVEQEELEELSNLYKSVYELEDLI